MCRRLSLTAQDDLRYFRLCRADIILRSKVEGYRTNEIARYLISRTNILQKFELTPASTDLPELVITEQRSGLFIHPLSNALLVTGKKQKNCLLDFLIPLACLPVNRGSHR
ncbi:MAG: hypothetical protein IPK94_05505 [Saprospiraceae bacterium]|nr:hypothetical protein [Saprospiraceae bacterium]